MVGLNITTNLRPKARPPPRSPSPRRCGPPPRPLARRQPHASPLGGPLRFCVRARARGGITPPPPPSRTNWTRLVPPPVLIGHVSPWLPRLLSVNVHSRAPPPPPPPPPSRTKWTRRVPPPVLIGHAASLTPYEQASDLSRSLPLRQVQYLIEDLGVPKSEVGRLVRPRPRRPSQLCLRSRAAPCRRSGALRGAGAGGAVPTSAGDEHREQDQAGGRLPRRRSGHPPRQARPGRRPIPAGLRPAQPSQPTPSLVLSGHAASLTPY